MTAAQATIEYKVLEARRRDVIEADLNEHAQDGWVLDQVVLESAPYWLVILKRSVGEG